MTKHVLVTGLNGFVGHHLAKTLAAEGINVSGLTYGGGVSPDISPLLDSNHACDLTDMGQVNNLDLSPYDAIINLAGLANVGQSFDSPDLYMRVNVKVLDNLCARLVEQKLSPRIVAISTGAVYASDQTMPLSEKSKLISKGSPYAFSKIAMEKVAEKYKKIGLPELVIVRPFNHIGPGQKEGFILPDLYSKITNAIKTGESAETGNLNTRRDYTDVRDVCRAYMQLAAVESKRLSSAVYNVCSGVSHSGKEILTELKQLIPGANDVQIKVNQKFIRANDPEELVGNNHQLQNDTGWQPEMSFEQTIKDFVKSQK